MKHAKPTAACVRLTRRPPPRKRGITSALTGAAAAGTVLTGLLLDIAVAIRFGAGWETDAFFVAARLPVGVAMVLLGGANLVLVPAITALLAQRPPRAVRATVTSLALLTLVCTVAAAAVLSAAAPVVVRIIAPGLDATTSAEAANLLRVLSLVIPLTGLAELMRALANTREAFVFPAGANALLNVVAATFILTFAHLGIIVAAWAYVAGGVARVVLLLPVCRRLGWGLRWRSGGAGGWRDPDAVRMLRLSLRPSASSGLAPAVRIVEQVFASFLPAGSITLLNYGYRLIFAIGGTVVFRSVLDVLTPRLARAQLSADDAAVHQLTRSGLRTVVLLATVLTVNVATLGVPAAIIVFDRGAFERDAAQTLGLLLALLSLCLVAEGFKRALMAPFYARLDTKNPLRNALVSAGTNVVLIPVLTVPFGGSSMALFGIAAAFVLATYVGAIDAWLRWRRTRAAASIGLARLSAVLLPSTALAALAALALRSAWNLDTPANAAVGLLLIVLAGTIAAGVVMGGHVVGEPGLARSLLRRRRRPAVHA